MRSHNVLNKILKSGLQSALGRLDKGSLSEKAPYYSQTIFCSQYCTPHCQNGRTHHSCCWWPQSPIPELKS